MTVYSPPPLKAVAPYHITPWSYESIGLTLSSYGQTAPGTGAGTVVDLVIYVPFEIGDIFVVKEVGWANGSITGNSNAQVGVYNEAGTQLVECTATTTSGTTTTQMVDCTDTTLTPGRYYMAFRAHSATDRFQRIVPAAGLLQSCGIMQETSQTDLPATATFAAMTNAFLPLFILAGHTLL